MGAVVSGLVATFVVTNAETIGSTVAGLALIYAMGFTDSVTYMARCHAECQMSLNSVQRIMEYLEVDKENYAGVAEEGSGEECVTSFGTNNRTDNGSSSSGSSSWPMDGTVEFRNISLKYQINSPPVLK